MDKVALNIGNAQTRAAAKTSLDKNKEAQDRKLQKACRDFEAIFTYNLLKNMRRTIPHTSGGNLLAGEDTYNMLRDQKVAEEISKKGNGLGLHKLLFDQLNKNYIKEDAGKKIK
jgi:peptidoglycan hydrolase FlgJ